MLGDRVCVNLVAPPQLHSNDDFRNPCRIEPIEQDRENKFRISRRGERHAKLQLPRISQLYGTLLSDIPSIKTHNICESATDDAPSTSEIIQMDRGLASLRQRLVWVFLLVTREKPL